MSDEILVRWQDDDDGWREGVLCAVYVGVFYYTPKHLQRMVDRAADYTLPNYIAVIWDRHHNKRCIVPLAKISLAQPRCDACEGTGVTYRMEWVSFSVTQRVATQETCAACGGTGKAK